MKAVHACPEAAGKQAVQAEPALCGRTVAVQPSLQSKKPWFPAECMPETTAFALQQGQPFRPLVAMPSTRYFCRKMKISSTGRMDSVLMANMAA